VEALEDRRLLSQVNLTVSSLADSGPGTLRAAIVAADAGKPSDKFTIGFSMTGTVDLQSPLPDLNNNIAIQGPGGEQPDRRAGRRCLVFLGHRHRRLRPDRQPLRLDDRQRR
jgi:hypothetical protein